MRVKMLPGPKELHKRTSGIDQVVAAYHRILPQFGIELVGSEIHDFDLLAIHVGGGVEGLSVPLVLHNHGIHWIWCSLPSHANC